VPNRCASTTKPLGRYGLSPTTSRMTRLRATFTGAKWRFVSKASAGRSASNVVLTAALPRKPRLLISVLTVNADYADLLVCAIWVICGHGFVSGMARTDGGDSDPGALQRARLGLRAEV